MKCTLPEPSEYPSRRENDDTIRELWKVLHLVEEMREAQKEYHRLRYSQRHDKREEAGERMSDLQRTVDAELREILELEEYE